MRTVTFEELSTTPPMSMAPGAVVVTAGTLSDIAAAPAAVVAVASSGLVLSTPE